MGYTKEEVYALMVGFASSALVDATTYYFGQPINAVAGSEGYNKIVIPVTGTIRRVNIQTWAVTVAGTGEDWSIVIRKNATTDYAVATVSLAQALRLFSNNALNIPVTAGDTIELKTVTPTWVTNPDGVKGYGSIVVTV